MLIDSRALKCAAAVRRFSGIALIVSVAPLMAQAQARWTLKETLRIGGAEWGQPRSSLRDP